MEQAVKRKQHHPRCDSEAASHLFLPHSDGHLLPAAVQHGGRHRGGAVCGHATPWRRWGHHRHPHQPAGGLLCGGVLRRHGDYLPVLRRRRDGKNVSKAVHTSTALALAGGLVIMVLGLLTARPSAGAAWACPRRYWATPLTYMNMYYCGIIASMIYNVGTGVLRAIGDCRMPLYVLIVCCLVNIVLDLLFVLGFHMGRVRRGLCHGASPRWSARCLVHGAADAHPGELPGGARNASALIRAY